MKKLRWISVLAYACLIFYLSSRAIAVPQNMPMHLDKLIHLILYAVLGFALLWALRVTVFKNHPQIVMISTMLAIFYGAAIEFFQSFFPGRSAEAMDLLADAIGSFLGAYIAALVAEKIRGKRRTEETEYA